MSDCPIATEFRQVNLQNHIICIDLANLGPADPRQPNEEYWKAKMKTWGVLEGEARSRLCMTCEHYIATIEMLDCIDQGNGATLKASELPVTPKWADIAGIPAGYCDRYNITCSAIRTCDDWEPQYGNGTNFSYSID